MTRKANSLKFRRQRKFLLLLPVLTLPFITVVFWALGGGSAVSVERKTDVAGRLMTQVPDAKLKDENSLNKMSFYEKAALDSIRRKEMMKIDPYYQLRFDSAEMSHPSPPEKSSLMSPSNMSKPSSSVSGIQTFSDPNEQKVYRKLTELNDALERASKERPKISEPTVDQDEIEMKDQEVDTSGTSAMVGLTAAEDPELRQLDGMLEKILDIQHPQRVKEKVQESSVQSRRQVFPVTLKAPDEYSSVLEPSDSEIDSLRQRNEYTNRFYSLDDYEESGIDQNAIEAVNHVSQSIVSGASIKLRILDDMYVRGLLIPKGSFISGITSIVNERLHVSINSIRFQHFILPVNLTVFDLDGMEGIYIPGTISNELKNEVADNTLQSIGTGSLYPSVANQAATAGLQAAKNLLTRKTKIVKVEIKAGYRILLVNKDAAE